MIQHSVCAQSLCLCIYLADLSVVYSSWTISSALITLFQASLHPNRKQLLIRARIFQRFQRTRGTWVLRKLASPHLVLMIYSLCQRDHEDWSKLNYLASAFGFRGSFVLQICLCTFLNTRAHKGPSRRSLSETGCWSCSSQLLEGGQSFLPRPRQHHCRSGAWGLSIDRTQSIRVLPECAQLFREFSRPMR